MPSESTTLNFRSHNAILVLMGKRRRPRAPEGGRYPRSDHQRGGGIQDGQVSSYLSTS